MTPEEFSREIFLLMEKGLSISPQGANSEDLAQNFKDKNIQPTMENVYMLVIKSRAKKLGDFDDSVVARYGELSWFTLSEEEESKIKMQYQTIVNQIITILTSRSSMSMLTIYTTSTTEQPWEDIFNDERRSYFVLSLDQEDNRAFTETKLNEILGKLQSIYPMAEYKPRKDNNFSNNINVVIESPLITQIKWLADNKQVKRKKPEDPPKW
ncbi:18263_t:CDS:2, partial [Dentiscutata erythropus]